VRQAVIDNIQIQISDIHVSFREPSSSASVMHFTIDSLRLHPHCRQWRLRLICAAFARLIAIAIQ
jgi:hypothetical protein